MDVSQKTARPSEAAAVIAFYTARALHGDSVYSEPVRRKQQRTTQADISALRVGDILQPSPASVLESASLEQIARQFAAYPAHHLPVVTLDGRLQGLISIKDLDRALPSPQSAWIKAASLMGDHLPIITTDTSLAGALSAFDPFKGERLPVVNNPQDRRLVGCVSRTDVLLSLQHGIKGSAH